jgi:hypothetical protein
MLVLQAAMLGIVTLGAYAQQENDPTWYDPWAKGAPVAQAPQPVRKPRKVLAVSSDHAANRKPAKTRQSQRPQAVALVRK